MIHLPSLDPAKHAVRLAVWAMHKAVRKDAEAIGAELESSPDAVARTANEALLSVAANVSREHQARMVREVGQFFIYVLSRDTAYRDLRNAALTELLRRAPEFAEQLRAEAQPPEKWYINAYEASVEENRRRGAAGLATEEEQANPDAVDLEV